MFLQKCECGGKYKLIGGISYGCSPPAHPVACEDCDKEAMAHLDLSNKKETNQEVDIMKYAKDYEKGY